MVNTMKREEHVLGDPISDKEVPTPVAELFIRLVPGVPGNKQFKPPSAGFMQRFKKDHGGGPGARGRIRAAIEAETAAVPEVAAEVIDNELRQIMSAQQAANHPGARRVARPVPRTRRSPVTEELRGSMKVLLGSPARATGRPGSDDQEPTAAAELRIMLLHS